jgi:hypothetical protein
MTLYGNLSKRAFRFVLEYKDSLTVSCRQGYWASGAGACNTTYTIGCNRTRQIEGADFCTNICEVPVGNEYAGVGVASTPSSSLDGGGSASYDSNNTNYTGNASNESLASGGTGSSTPAATLAPTIYQPGYVFSSMHA